MSEPKAVSGRRRLPKAARDYALFGGSETVRKRTDRLQEAGNGTNVGYPARTLDAFVG